MRAIMTGIYPVVVEGVEVVGVVRTEAEVEGHINVLHIMYLFKDPHMFLNFQYQ
jgi:hypothetical protein